MPERVNKIKNNESLILALILAIGVYLALYNSPLFGEYNSAASHGRVTSSAAIDEAMDFGEGWFVIKSNYFTIYCEQTVDLENVESRLERRGLFTSGVYGPNPASSPPQKIAYRLDRLLKKAKEILDMNPDMARLKIRIFKDRDQLDDFYFRLFGDRPGYKSFYIHKLETIYTSEEDISDMVIVHEMGHAIVDNYFSVIPPEKIRELLASFVEQHLEDEEY